MYENSPLLIMIDVRRKAGLHALGLFTDVDHSYQKTGMEKEMDDLTQWLMGKNIPTIAITGNDFMTMQQRIDRGEIPRFQAMACSVGTELWILGNDDTYSKDADFEQKLFNKGFVRSALVTKAEVMIDELKETHPEWAFDFQHAAKEQEVKLHPDPTYQTFKVSFYFFASFESLPEVTSVVQTYFKDQRIVVCEEINHNSRLPNDAPLRKYCLDILPVTKSDVVKYLVDMLGLEHGVVAGDSGNDTEMLKNAPPGFVAVLVGGAKKEAVEEIRMQAPHVYVEESVDRIGPQSILHACKVLEQKIRS